MKKLFFLLLLAIPMLCIGIDASGQSLRGNVRDANNVPVAGVSVFVSGTTNGTVTDNDGNYVLSNVKPDDNVTFSFIGFKEVVVPVANRGTINVVMEEDAELLGELVVIGYGTKRKGGIASAVSTVQADDIARTTASTLSGAIVGKLAGVSFRQNNGLPGVGAQLQIRNQGTPLYVIDGIISDETFFNNLDANDIDNISVLKDGAAAIYGVKAANGVILVTTKNGGKGQKAQVSFDANYGWSTWAAFPEMLNAYQWQFANYMGEMNQGSLTVSTDYAKAELEKWKEGYYNPSTGEDYRGFDWFNEYIDKHAPQQYYHVSLTGGGDKTTYYMSVSQVDQDAVYQDMGYKRTNVQSNFTMDITPKLKMGFQFNGHIGRSTEPAISTATWASGSNLNSAHWALFETAPIYRPYANDNENYLFSIPGRSMHNLAAFTIDNAGKKTETTTEAQAIWSLDWQTPLKGLTGRARYSYIYSDYLQDFLRKSWNEYSYDAANDQYNVAATYTAVMYRNNTNTRKSSGQFLLDYDNTFGLHHVTAVGGFEFSEIGYHGMSNTQSPAANQYVDLFSTNAVNTVSESKHTYTTASFVFRAGEDYDNKYIIDFAARYDGSWKFPKGKRWGFFPSVSAAWRISQEDFFQNSSISNWFSNLKLRASYGEMGDDALSGYADYAYLPGYTYNRGSYLFSNSPLSSVNSSYVLGTVSNGVPITTLSWMTVKTMNVGVDMGFFNNRLTAEVDAFKRIRTGIPGTPNDVIFPTETGLSVLPQNLNSDMTLGVDGYLRWNDKIGDFKYNIGVTATFARNKNGEIYGELFRNAWNQYYSGKSNRWSNAMSSYGAIWMYDVIGIFQTQEEIDNYPVEMDNNYNKNVRPGDVIFKDQNGDGYINDYDLRPQSYCGIDYEWDHSAGNRTPILSGGLNFGFEWKGVDFAADFVGGFLNSWSGDWYTKWSAIRSQNGFVYNNIDTWQHEDIFDLSSPWIPGNFPPNMQLSTSTGRWWNSYLTQQVNYVRLRNLVVGYTLPKAWTDKIRLQKLRLYMQGTNLLTFGKLFGSIDPENSAAAGLDYPQHKSIIIGVNVDF